MVSLECNIPIVGDIIFAFDTERPLTLLTATGGVSNFLKRASRFTAGSASGLDLTFAMLEMFGTPKTLNRFRQGLEILMEGGIRDRDNKLLAPIRGTDEHFRSFLRGKYGSIAAKDWIRNIGVKSEERRWFVLEVELLKKGDYTRKAELYSAVVNETL